METTNKKGKNVLIIITTLIFIISISVLLVAILMLNKKVTIVSYGNNDKTCKTERVKIGRNKILEKYIKNDNLKIDEVTITKKIKKEELKNVIQESDFKYLKYGIAFDEDINKFLLKEEINSKQLINYETYTLKITEVNEYFSEKGESLIDSIPDEMWIFETDGYYYENQEWHKLSEQNGYEVRELDVSKENLSERINLMSKRIMALEKDDGEYIYGFQTNIGEELADYNILRHAGTTWSQILAYQENPNNKLKNKISKAIEYLINNNTKNYDNITYVIEDEEILLGGNALTLLMLSEYETVFNDNKYKELSNQLVNGILKMQEDDGSFNHVYKLDLSLSEKYRIVYYDGEAVYALMKYYNINKDEKVLSHVTKALDYFIENDYAKYADHWIAYGLSEYLKYNQEEKYILLAFKNYTMNRGNINKSTRFNPTGCEMILATYNSYKYIKEINPENPILNKMPIENLEKAIKFRMNNLFSYYIYPEVAMYMENPDKVKNGFHNIEYRMRIDDIQHSLAAVIMYKKLELSF